MSFPLSALGGGGLSTSASATSGTGDQGQTLDFGFQNSSPFVVGGSGSANQEAAATQAKGAEPPLNNNTLLIAAAVAVGLFFVYRASR